MDMGLMSGLLFMSNRRCTSILVLAIGADGEAITGIIGTGIKPAVIGHDLLRPDWFVEHVLNLFARCRKTTNFSSSC